MSNLNKLFSHPRERSDGEGLGLPGMNSNVAPLGNAVAEPPGVPLPLVVLGKHFSVEVPAVRPMSGEPRTSIPPQVDAVGRLTTLDQ